MNHEDPFPIRAARLLSAAFGGMHNVPGKLTKHTPDERGMGEMWSLQMLRGQAMGTYDFNQLSMLVIGAHVECVRVCVFGKGMNAMYITLHPRKPEGAMHERHPNLFDAEQTYVTRAAK